MLVDFDLFLQGELFTYRVAVRDHDTDVEWPIGGVTVTKGSNIGAQSQSAEHPLDRYAIPRILKTFQHIVRGMVVIPDEQNDQVRLTT